MILHAQAAMLDSEKRKWAGLGRQKIDPGLNQNTKQAKQVPVLVNYSVGRQRHEKRPDKVDLALINKISGVDIEGRYPTTRMPEGAETRRNDPIGVTHVHHFYTHRNLIALSALRSLSSGLFGATASVWIYVHTPVRKQALQTKCFELL